MKGLEPTTKLVKSILEVDRQARNSDSILYLRVMERIAEENGIKLDYLTARHLFTDMHHLPFPPTESVRRSRQKLQREYPELASDKRIAKLRMENEKVYRAFALGECDA